jgi:CheY-like chemotaxis protein
MTTRVRPRVLLADDYSGILAALRRLLTPDCDVVACVSDGAAALEATARLQPDVIVLDVNMPDVSGLEVCREVTRTNPHVRVILLSAAGDGAIRDKGLALGAFAVLAKQQVTDRLLAAIQEAHVTRR